MKFNVYGAVTVSVKFIVEAESGEDAIQKAYDEFPGLTGYVGNGGTDKLVGVADTSISLDTSCSEAEFIVAELVE